MIEPSSKKVEAFLLGLQQKTPQPKLRRLVLEAGLEPARSQ